MKVLSLMGLRFLLIDVIAQTFVWDEKDLLLPQTQMTLPHHWDQCQEQLPSQRNLQSPPPPPPSDVERLLALWEVLADWRSRSASLRGPYRSAEDGGAQRWALSLLCSYVEVKAKGGVESKDGKKVVSGGQSATHCARSGPRVGDVAFLCADGETAEVGRILLLLLLLLESEVEVRVE